MADDAGKRAAALELASKFKGEGNTYFKQKHMLAAIDSYTKAIAALRESPDIDSADCDAHVRELASVLYANRAAACLGYQDDRFAKVALFSDLGVSDDFVGDSVWQAEVLRQLDAAEKDARVAVEFNGSNAKAHFRLGAALLDLARLDVDLADRAGKLRAASAAFARSNELQPSPGTKAKEDLAAKMASEEGAMGGVKPIVA